MSKKTKNFEKPSKMTKNGQIYLKRQKCRKTVKKTVKNVEKKLKIFKNSQKTCQKCRKIIEMAKTVRKQSKMS